MPGAGKSTIGAILAEKMGWAFIDTDNIIEALYAAPLQAITDAAGKNCFVEIECEIISNLLVSRCVIATGGSVVYKKKAMKYLSQLGPVIHIDIPYEIVEERILQNPLRGIAIGEGQTLRDIYEERKALYTEYGMLNCQAYRKSPEQCAESLCKKLKKYYGIEPEI